MSKIKAGCTLLKSIFHADFKNCIHFGVCLAIEESRLFEFFFKNLFLEAKQPYCNVDNVFDSRRPLLTLPA